MRRRFCRACGQEFVAIKRTGAYCSNKCRQRQYRARKHTESSSAARRYAIPVDPQRSRNESPPSSPAPTAAHCSIYCWKCRCTYWNRPKCPSCGAAPPAEAKPFHKPVPAESAGKKSPTIVQERIRRTKVDDLTPDFPPLVHGAREQFGKGVRS